MTTFRDLAFHAKGVTDVKWNHDGQYLGSASYDKTIKIGQLESAGGVRVVHTVTGAAPMVQVCWHPTDANRFFAVGDDKTIEMWDVRASRPALKFASLGSNLFTSWSPDGKYFAVGNKQDNVVVFDVDASRQVKKVKFGYEVNELAWSANSDYLLIATGGGDMGSVDVIRFKDSDLQHIESVAAHTSNCLSLKIDSGFRRMAVGSADYMVSLWDLEDLSCHHTVAFEAPIRGLCFNGTGQYVCAVPEAPSVFLIQADSAEVVSKLDLTAACNAVAWHPQNNLILALGSDDRTHAHPQNLRIANLSKSIFGQ